MTKETLKALKASIAHWKRLATGKARGQESIGSLYCDLCHEHLYKDTLRNCLGCPVAERTGKIHCAGSPFEEVKLALTQYGKGSKEFKLAASKELKFLKSLLP